MRSIVFLFLTLFTIQALAQKQVDTTQKIIPGRFNSEEAKKQPYVILISADGFRYDYAEKYHANYLLSLAHNGIWAKDGMYPSYPSITFPNHYSIATGLYPAHHGIVDNVFYDPARKEKYIIGTPSILDGSWYGGEPLWSLAEKQGMLAASLFWVGSESDAGGMRPTYYYAYHEKFSGADKAQIIKNWLSLPEDRRPHFITLYFPEVDHKGHSFGPDARQTEYAVQYIDSSIQKLTEALTPLNLPINYIFLSDHGMIAVEQKDYIPMPPIDKDKFVVVNSGTFARITALDPKDIDPLYKALCNGNHDNYKIYLAKDFPRKLHYSTREDHTRRIGDIILVPNGSKILVDVGRKTSIGKHGFDPHEIPEMKATYIAWGPAFKTSKEIRPFSNVNVYPLIAHILNLNITQPIDGKFKKLKKTLKR